MQIVINFILNLYSSKQFQFAVSCCAGGVLILWENLQSADLFKYKPIVTQSIDGKCNTVCNGIEIRPQIFVVGCITSESEIFLYSTDNKGKIS